MKLRVDISIEIPVLFEVSVVQDDYTIAFGRSEEIGVAFDQALARLDATSLDPTDMLARVVLKSFRESLGIPSSRAQA